MKLQVAFDTTDLEKALSVAHAIEPHVDIFEVGTLLIYAHGIHAVEKFKQSFPKKALLADAKIMDRSKDAVTLFATAGADWITVMAGAQSSIIHAACTTAHSLGKKIMLDLADASSLGQSALEAKSLGVEALLFHKSTAEAEREQFTERWEMVKGNTTLPIYILANISRENIADVLLLQPQGAVLGNAIVTAENPGQEAAYFATLVRTGF